MEDASGASRRSMECCAETSWTLVLSYVYGVLHTTTWLTSQVLGLGDLRDMASYQTYVFGTTIRSREAVKILVI